MGDPAAAVQSTRQTGQRRPPRPQRSGARGHGRARGHDSLVRHLSGAGAAAHGALGRALRGADRSGA